MTGASPGQLDAPQTGAIHPVILSGGAGSRLWPVSRSLHPKQLQPLLSQHSLLQDTASRFTGQTQFQPPVIICNNEHRFIIAEQLREINITPALLILEPVGRNTAPAAAIAALSVLAYDRDAILLLTPADHCITDTAAFITALEAGAKAARAGYLVTFGVTPERPETGYGYIKSGGALPEFAGITALRKALQFVEKPDLATATAYLATGGYFWNSGIFMFRADRYLEILQRLRPAMLEACKAALDSGHRDLDFFRLDEAAFGGCEAESIDYAVMEHADNVVMVAADIGWSDIGAWNALWDVAQKDTGGNALLGDVIALETRNSYIRAESRLIATLGVENLVVVETADAVLVTAMDKAQQVKALVDALKSHDRGEHAAHLRIYRPWGFYESLAKGERHQVKHLMIKAGGKLSLQMHQHRAEHWVVVRGAATVTRDGQTHLLGENQSIYLPPGCKHRLENAGVEPLSVIEVQTGAYLGEDDIVRFEDIYNRETEAAAQSSGAPNKLP